MNLWLSYASMELAHLVGLVLSGAESEIVGRMDFVWRFFLSMHLSIPFVRFVLLSAGDIGRAPECVHLPARRRLVGIGCSLRFAGLGQVRATVGCLMFRSTLHSFWSSAALLTVCLFICQVTL